MFFVKCTLLFSCLAISAWAQTLADYSFTVTGFLAEVNVDGTPINSGGSIKVSGFDIVIPKNLLVDFPAAQVPFKEFAAGVRAGPNEVSVFGNVVNGVIIAGIFEVSQLSLAGGTGYIESLSFDGAIKIRNGPTIRINDPRGRYSAGFDAVPLFTADDENPSIIAFTGFPMCVPREVNDPKCPQSNRPTTVPNPRNYFVPDPLHMAPLKVGDFLEYSYIEFNNELVCFAITANIGIYTAANVKPAFIRVEDALIGVIDTVNVDVEFARARFVGYTSDPNTLIRIYAMDVDPCTGDVTDRLIGSATPEVAAGGRAKWEWRSDRTDIGLYTRNYRVTAGSGTQLTSDGILAGQYIQPVTEWIFPEVITPGALPPPLDFNGFGHLANGFGPSSDGSLIFGQLDPWPGATPPTPISASCSLPNPTPTETSTATDTATPTPVAVPITANAGTDLLVRGGLRVTLSATQGLAGIPASALTYSWTQIGGPTAGITLSSSSSATTTLDTPQGIAVREFAVTITHQPSGSTANDTVLLTTDNTSSDHIVIDTFTWVSRQSGTVNIVAHTDLVDPSATMRLRFNGGTAEIVLVKQGPGLFSYSARSTARPTSLRLISYIVPPGQTAAVAVGTGIVTTTVG